MIAAEAIAALGRPVGGAPAGGPRARAGRTVRSTRCSRACRGARSGRRTRCPRSTASRLAPAPRAGALAGLGRRRRGVRRRPGGPRRGRHRDRLAAARRSRSGSSPGSPRASSTRSATGRPMPAARAGRRRRAAAARPRVARPSPRSTGPVAGRDARPTREADLAGRRTTRPSTRARGRHAFHVRASRAPRATLCSPTTIHAIAGPPAVAAARGPTPMADVQRTLLLVKPDGVQRQLVGRVLTRFEERGLKIVGLKLVHVDRALAEAHYAVHRERPFFAGLVDFITSGPLVAVALEGPNAIAIVRAMNGATRPHEAAPGLDPRRLRRRDRAEPGPRLGRRGDRRRRARPLVQARGAARATSARSTAGCSLPRSRRGPPATSVAAAGQQDRRGLRGRAGEVERAPAGERGEDREREHRGRQQLRAVAAPGSPASLRRRGLGRGAAAGGTRRPRRAARPGGRGERRTSPATVDDDPTFAGFADVAAWRSHGRRLGPRRTRSCSTGSSSRGFRRRAIRSGAAPSTRLVGPPDARAQQPQVGRQGQQPGEEQQLAPGRVRRRRRPARSAPRAPPSPGSPIVATVVTTSAAASSGERRIHPRRSGMLRVPNRSSVDRRPGQQRGLRRRQHHDPRAAGAPGRRVERRDREQQQARVGDHQVPRRVAQVVVDERRERRPDERREREQRRGPAAPRRAAARAGPPAGRPPRAPPPSSGRRSTRAAAAASRAGTRSASRDTRRWNGSIPQRAATTSAIATVTSPIAGAATPPVTGAGRPRRTRPR